MNMTPLSDSSAFRAISGLWAGKKGPLTEGHVIRSTNFRKDGLLDYSDIAKLEVEERAAATRELEALDIIIERSGGGPKQPVGRVGLFVPPEPTKQYFTSNFTTALRIVDQECFDPLFVSLFLQALYSGGATETLQRATTGIRNLDWTEYLNFAIPEIDIAAQRFVANGIDRVRQAYRFEEQLILLAQELKGATMRELFTRGLRGEVQKDSEIGPLPGSWEIKTLLELCSISSGGTPRKSVAEYWNGDIPWVSGKDLKKSTLDDAIDHISEDGAAAGSKIAPADTVLILVRGMGLAKDLPVSRISRPMAFNQDVKALISKGEVSGAFLRSAIYNRKDALLSRIVPSAHGTMTLNLDDLESFKIGCPTDPDEIAKITTTLDAMDAKIDLHKRKKAVLEELFRSLLHKLMTGEIRTADLDDMASLEAKQEVAV